MELEKLAQNPLKNLRENSPQMPQFIELKKTSRWSQDGLSVDRPVDRPTVRNLTVVPAVDRGLDTESRLSVRSTGPVDQGFPESRSSLAVDRVGRPALQYCLACTTSSSVDRSGRPAEARTDS